MKRTIELSTEFENGHESGSFKVHIDGSEISISKDGASVAIALADFDLVYGQLCHYRAMATEK